MGCGKDAKWKSPKALFHFAWKSRTERGITTFPQPRLLLFRKHETTTPGILIVVHRKEWLTPYTLCRFLLFTSVHGHTETTQLPEDIPQTLRP